MWRRLVLIAALAGCGRIGFDARSDGSLGDGGVPTCNPIDRISDDFEDGVQDPVLWGASYEAGATYAETGGDLVITPPTNVTGNAYAGYRTLRFYDLRAHRVIAEVAEIA